MKENPREDVYAGYIEMKGWRERFQHAVADARLFEHEFRTPLTQGRPQSLIDIGFGGGTLLSWARSRGLEVCGLEVQQALVAEAREVGFKVYENLAEIPTESLDLATCMDVVEHMTADTMQEALVEIRRILRPGGWLVIRTPNCQSPAGLIDQFGDGTHRQMLSGPILSECLRKGGFAVREVRGAKNRANYVPGLLAGVRRSIKTGLAVPARLVLRLALGTGGSILEPSILVVANRSSS